MSPKAKNTAKATHPDYESIKNMNLDQKIEAFRTYMLAQKDNHSRGIFLKRYFNQNEMSALWSRLNTLRNQSKRPEIAKTWKQIQDAKDGSKTERKQQFLATALVFPEQ